VFHAEFWIKRGEKGKGQNLIWADEKKGGGRLPRGTKREETLIREYCKKRRAVRKTMGGGGGARERRKTMRPKRK